MAKDLWLPKGYKLQDGSEVNSLLFWGDQWQIYGASDINNILLASPELAQKWHDKGFLDESLFDVITFGDASFRVLYSPYVYSMAPVEVNRRKLICDKMDALSFAIALHESRELSKDDSFHDAIYVEQYSRLLPTWTVTPRISDDVILGKWLTGGVVISTDSFRRLTQLAGWMDAGDIAEIVHAAGLYVPADVYVPAGKQSAIAVTPEGEREILSQSTSKVFSLPGRPQIEEFFNEHVIDIVHNAEKYQRMGIEFPSSIVLYGPPGCGKTYAVERLVEFLDWPSFPIDSSSVGSPYIHETSRKISEVFDKAVKNSPAVIIIDEMESFLSERQTGATGQHHVEEVAEFLRRLSEMTKNKVLVIAMTNQIDMIDPAIIRRGRFDHIVEVKMPSKLEVSALIESLLNKLPKEDNLNVEIIINALTGKALSDAAFVVREAARLTAKSGKPKLDQVSLDTALASLPKEKNKKIGFIKE
ncbi:MAG: ATP-binding protein [Synergistaceae bacterium]|nr:ATP-binding protein [Synergistaceae bacterium]